MNEDHIATLTALWEQHRDAIVASRGRTDPLGRRLFHLHATLWHTQIEEVFGTMPFTIQWSDDGCTVEGHLFPYTP